MDISGLLKDLNKKQREAVAAPNGNLLVLAGAGSGKTCVLIRRIAWLISIENCLPCSVMAVTFTNKAALEIRKRIESLLGTRYGTMWIGTFHGLTYRLLRAHYQDANLPPDFQILDGEDQLKLLTSCMHAMNLDEKKWSPRKAMWYIDSKKDAGLRPQDINSYDKSVETIWQSVYRNYQETCDRAGLVDFSELLIRAYELWRNKPSLLSYYQQRFSNILIDEFQDTNKIQYAWIRMLAGHNNNVMIVGDDDQSIYGWRGAYVDNIQRFLNDFSSVRRVSLEQNYRSTGNILKAANTLIAHNYGRLGKNLWTKSDEGELITLYCACNEIDEAHFVVDRIKMYNGRGGELKDCAILYRSNVQSRILEQVLLQKGLPYRIYGGLRFFERQEIKDALAYLRLIINRNDDVAYERVVNVPPRGLGNRTLELVRRISREQQLTLWQSSQLLLREGSLIGRTGTALKQFLELISALEKETVGLKLHIQTERIIKNSGLWYMYERKKEEKIQTRVENLKELVTATHQFNYRDEENHLLPLQSFLSHVALEAGEQQRGTALQDAVQLMTIHASKGLEFNQVFIVGMEEGMFPSKMSLDTPEGLPEERRLAYVGITRAMKKLTITYSKTRWLYGKEVFHQPSRFIKELPSAYIEKACFRAIAGSLASHQPTEGGLNKNDSGFMLGQRVRHPKFGEGTVVNLVRRDRSEWLQILFQKHGTKWITMTYAQLETI